MQKTGYYLQDDGEGKQTRMWSTDRLWSLFCEYRLMQTGFFRPVSEPDEIIVLRDESKTEVGYRETTQTRRMRTDLERYNSLVRKHQITLRLGDDTIVDNRFLTEDIHRNIANGKIWIKSVQLNPAYNWDQKPTPITNFFHHLQKFTHNPKYIINNILDKYKPSSSITHTKLAIALLRMQLRRFWSDEHRLEKFLDKRCSEIQETPWEQRQDLLAEVFLLGEVGVDELEIVLDQEQLHRIFNRRSWELGGRAYGALHQDTVRKYMRGCILIDGQPTTEIDFSAFHILMLYHLEGIDHQEDPYSACEGPGMRDTYKAVGLIAINAENPRDTYGAIRDELKERGIPLPTCKEPLKTLVNVFREAHKAIHHHPFTGVGLILQNIDSHIMNAILVRLMDLGILGLPVHDSVIVARQHADYAREVMTEEYEKVMGFRPRF